MSQTRKNYRAVAEWALTGSTGMSSDALACRYLGLVPRYGDQHPHDCGDFHNCYRLVQAAGNLDVAVMSGRSPAWDKLIPAWPELTAAWEAEAPGNRWPKFNALLNSVLGVKY